MASKKYKLLMLGVFFLLSFGAFAQTDSGIYDVFDSTVIPNKGLAQHNEFMNNTYDFPAKPRNEWELGVSGGMMNISGDVSAKLPTFGFGVHVRKALGYLFSLRLQYINGVAKGLNWQASQGYSNNPAWANNGYTAPQDFVYYNYRSRIQDLSLQGIFSINNIRFHKNKSSVVFYVGAGAGATVYHTMVNALDANNNPYTTLFNSINASGYSNRKDIKKQLKDGMDDTYETPAENNRNNQATAFGMPVRLSATVLGGVEFKLGKRVNLAIEDRFTGIRTDLLDGQQWQEHPVNDPAQSRDFDSYNYLSVGLNLNIGNKAVEPLWWINPLDYAYNELNNPKHMKMPKPVLPDEDGDGVTDQFDKCPGTPAGVPVDVNGCPLDTDGDGVPDYKDKELITPTYCQPVDADGVGKCPEPECCTELRDMIANANLNQCNIGDLPSINFTGRRIVLTKDAQAMLSTVASRLRNNPNCSITVTGYPEPNKASQSVANKRVEAIKAFLTEKEGISADRINTSVEVGGGAVNTIDLRTN